MSFVAAQPFAVSTDEDFKASAMEFIDIGPGECYSMESDEGDRLLRPGWLPLKGA